MLRKHAPGVYRITRSPERFAQIRRQGRDWLVEIRETESGHLVRFAGVWSLLRDAIEEAQSVNV